MSHLSNYNMKSFKKIVPMAMAIVLLAGAIALNVFVPMPEPDADVVCPMANTNISWLQTYHSGGWTE